MRTISLKHGDSLNVLKEYKDNSVDSVVTDPPYGLKFMAKKWDYDVPTVELWREVLRVLKPGGHLLSFGGTRTYHRMVVNIEDAGFEIRDQIMWLYGSGFPKSHNISKSIDKKFGAEREVVGIREDWVKRANKSKKSMGGVFTEKSCGFDPSSSKIAEITAPATDLAKQWDGFGTALKPANEPIVMARKPLSEKTIVDNVLKWGTGGINIDGCRVGNETITTSINTAIQGGNYGRADGISLKQEKTTHQGRFPANLILDDVAGAMLDEQSGTLAGDSLNRKPRDNQGCGGKTTGTFNPIKSQGFKDKGGASRFFYCAKAGKKERNAGMGELTNDHPTIKPIKLMSYLVRLVTPPGGTVLDPFMGSGSTGIAAKNEGFSFIGIEREAEYLEIARRRIGS